MFGVDVLTGVFAGCAVIAAATAARMQWRDHDRGTGGATMGVMMIAGHLWLLSVLFAGIALGVGMACWSMLDRWLYGVLTVVGGYFLSLILRSLVGSMAERFKPATPEPPRTPPLQRAELAGHIPKTKPVGRETHRLPPPGAVHFLPSRKRVRNELLLLSFAFAALPLVLGAYAITLVFPAMSPRYDFGVVAAVLYLFWHFRVLYPRQFGRALARDCIVESKGLHITRGDALIFLPWPAMVGESDGVTVTDHYLSRLGYVGFSRMKPSRAYQARYSYIPKPQELEDAQGYVEAIRQHAPPENPLRLYVEDWAARGSPTFSWREHGILIAVAVLLAAMCAAAYWFESK